MFFEADEDTDNMTATQLERRQVLLSYLGIFFDSIWACNLCQRNCLLPRESTMITKKQCCGSEMFIPDPNFSIQDPVCCIKEFEYFNPKNCF
jgi:hypothetical protein